MCCWKMCLNNQGSRSRKRRISLTKTFSNRGKKVSQCREWYGMSLSQQLVEVEGSQSTLLPGGGRGRPWKMKLMGWNWWDNASGGTKKVFRQSCFLPVLVCYSCLYSLYCTKEFHSKDISFLLTASWVYLYAWQLVNEEQNFINSQPREKNHFSGTAKT